MYAKPISVREPLILIGAFNLGASIISILTFFIFSHSLSRSFEIILLLGGALLLIAGSYTRRGSEGGTSKLFSVRILVSGLVLIVESFTISFLFG